MSRKPQHPYRVRCTITVTVQGGNCSQSRTTREQTITIRATSHAAALELGEAELLARVAGRATGGGHKP